MKIFLQRNDKKIALIFFIFTLVFLVLFLSNKEFVDWAYSRHQNVLSWYIRPLFIIPICFFAYKKSLCGMSLTIFALFTSMFWFNTPTEVAPAIEEFLAFEKSYTFGAWDFQKIFLSLSVPLFFYLLILAFWKRKLKYGIIIIIGAAVLKIIWSVVFAGDSGASIIKPAVTGLFICLVAVYMFARKKKRKS
ncbi:hypothetical protein [Clostridium lacusfryxellense]|uniref:hypothetical protein n=1 Tax=Clostridium lacusfryxellense TaxID=205328 RepID=UPI001C0C2167|nr:hypothetical protein [Clostridium lacusfryxellense]MBU3112083.1 hypothetical protein [Clostridium lacusfryxellense]